MPQCRIGYSQSLSHFHIFDCGWGQMSENDKGPMNDNDSETKKYCQQFPAKLCKKCCLELNRK